MARYYGTRGNDTVVGAAEQDFFYDFGVGQDVLVGGGKSDFFYLSVDDVTDRVDGRDGLDTIDYSAADRAVRIDLAAGTVTATLHYQGIGFSYDATRLVTQVQNVENATGSIYGDTIYGTDDKNTLDGNAGDDWLYGRGGDDTLIGGANADHLYGGDNDDTLIGGRGDDYINGGNGTSDTVSYADVDVGYGIFANLTEGEFWAGAHTVTVYFSGNQTETDTVVNVENVLGTRFDDSMEGGAVANVFDGGAGDDFLLGHDGDDKLIGGDGDDILVGGRGADHLLGGTGSDWALYGAFNEIGPPESPTGTVVINLTDPTQNTWRAAGDTYDSIENILGSSFVDIITGDDNNNIIVDVGGSNTFYGLDGMDTFTGSNGDGDRFYGGSGEDTVDYSGILTNEAHVYQQINHSNVTVDLMNQSLNAGAAAGDYFNSIEDIVGTEFDDTISGNVYDNVLIGYDGDDHLQGRGGVDTLVGGDGSDTAIFSGNFADYQFTTLTQVTDGHLERFLEVYDTHAWRDGIDYLYGVEHLQFHDRTVNTVSVMDPLFMP
jgi:Ca2+-binding RTX toxin-like protein